MRSRCNSRTNAFDNTFGRAPGSNRTANAAEINGCQTSCRTRTSRNGERSISQRRISKVFG
jgi:hypothetical protein